MILGSHRRWRGSAGALALALALCGCSDSGKAPVTKPDPQPGFTADSPVKAVRLLEWCWENRDLARYEELVTDDFLFCCAANDSAGNAFRAHELTRFDEIEIARHLFVGGGISPPANIITLQFDRNLIPQQDSRAGKQDPTYFQEITTSVVLRIRTDVEEFQVTGAARFFLARGDSALIPAELVARGFRSDPGHWYIQRWEDETMVSLAAAAGDLESPPLTTQPTRNTTFCSIKVLYR